MSLKQIEISLVDCCIAIRNVNPTLANSLEYYNIANIKSVVPIFVPGFGVRQADNNRLHPYPFDDKIEIEINFIAESQAPPINFDIQAISNQVGWTADQAGLDQALSDICGWICTCCGPAAALLAAQGTKTTPEVLSAPPLDPSANFAARDFRNFTFQVDVALAGAANVVVRAEGTLKDAPATDADWDNLDINNNDLTITADGVKLLSVANRKFEFVRLLFVSAAGGAPTVGVTILGGN